MRELDPIIRQQAQGPCPVLVQATSADGMPVTFHLPDIALHRGRSLVLQVDVPELEPVDPAVLAVETQALADALGIDHDRAAGILAQGRAIMSGRWKLSEWRADYVNRADAAAHPDRWLEEPAAVERLRVAWEFDEEERSEAHRLLFAAACGHRVRWICRHPEKDLYAVDDLDRLAAEPAPHADESAPPDWYNVTQAAAAVAVELGIAHDDALEQQLIRHAKCWARMRCVGHGRRLKFDPVDLKAYCISQRLGQESETAMDAEEQKRDGWYSLADAAEFLANELGTDADSERRRLDLDAQLRRLRSTGTGEARRFPKQLNAYLRDRRQEAAILAQQAEPQPAA